MYLCFGLFQRRGVQNIDLELRLEAEAHATFWSHCLFNQVERARHTMNARVEIEEGAVTKPGQIRPTSTKSGISSLPWRGDTGKGVKELGLSYRPLAESMNDFFQQIPRYGRAWHQSAQAETAPNADDLWMTIEGCRFVMCRLHAGVNAVRGVTRQATK